MIPLQQSQVMSLLLALGMLFLFGMSFTEKPTYEQILMRAKSGNLPELLDSRDSDPTPAGLY